MKNIKDFILESNANQVIFNACMELDNNYNIIVLDFNDAEYGNNWNPLSLIYDYYIKFYLGDFTPSPP